MTLQTWMILKDDYKVSGDQSGLEKNQLRLYRDVDDFNRIYVIITVEEEKAPA